MALHAPYSGLDSETSTALSLSPEALERAISVPLTLYDTNEEMIRGFADRIVDDLQVVQRVDRRNPVFIVPVGPVGQYPLLVERCLKEKVDLGGVTFIVMDEYLTIEGQWISPDDPLSFRRHLQQNLLDLLPEDQRPTVIVPDPDDLGAIPSLIERSGGVDVCYAGVGITGHLAFNDPIPGYTDPEAFGQLSTRIVSLLPETRLINSVTAARGNIERIPHLAVTVGMREILAARTLRIFMNRDWQCAAVRRLSCGPVTAAFPASLAQRHPNWTLDLVRTVLDQPEPGLR